ncbi:MAG TPA: oligopeptide ABC transporter permease [Bacillales bacterium]|nr:oligopeptide ABC transporter permease [Bacillales bacterium]
MKEEHLTKDMFQPVEKSEYDLENISRPSIGFWRDAWRRLFKNKGSVVGLILIIFSIFMAIFGPSMNDYGFNDQNPVRQYLPPRVPVLENIHWLGLDGVDFSGESPYLTRGGFEDSYFWFGTDSLGRDVWTRVWRGTRISLYIAFLAAAIDLLIGVVYGGVSAYYGGKVDNVMQRIIEVLIGIPNLIVIILFILWLQPGILSITLALVITGWVSQARIVRGQILKLKSDEFVLSARTLGGDGPRIIFKHLVPNTLGQIIITSMFTIPNAIFFEAFLSFIGLGIAPPEASLGSLTREGYESLQIYPYLCFFPAAVISLLMISFNLLADGMRDAFDPKMRR